MNRTRKQLAYGSLYLVILALIAGSIYFFIFKPAPSCSDDKQNQRETGIDCGGPCTPCEVKNLNLVTEDLEMFRASENQATFLAKIRNPSQAFTAEFTYTLELNGGTFNQLEKIKGRQVLTPGSTEYVVIPGIIAKDLESLDFDFNISDLNWSKNKSSLPDIKTVGRAEFDEGTKAITVKGTVYNNSAANFPSISLTAILFNREGETLNASVTRIGELEAFGQRQFTIFFPEEVKYWAEDIDPERTQIQWEINE